MQDVADIFRFELLKKFFFLNLLFFYRFPKTVAQMTAKNGKIFSKESGQATFVVMLLATRWNLIIVRCPIIAIKSKEGVWEMV